MKVIKKQIEQITIYYKSKESVKVFDKLFDGGYKVIYSGPVVKRFKATKDSYKVVAEREI